MTANTTATATIRKRLRLVPATTRSTAVACSPTSSSTGADLFRYQKTVGVSVALEGLREALRQKKVKPAELARQATKAKVWKTMEPYLAALTSHA